MIKIRLDADNDIEVKADFTIDWFTWIICPIIFVILLSIIGFVSYALASTYLF